MYLVHFSCASRLYHSQYGLNDYVESPSSLVLTIADNRRRHSSALVAQRAQGQFQVRIFDSHVVCSSEDLTLMGILGRSEGEVGT